MALTGLNSLEVKSEVMKLLADNCDQSITARDLRDALMIVFSNATGTVSPVYMKQLVSDLDEMGIDLINHSLQVTMEDGQKELKIYDEGHSIWLDVLSEQRIKEWIAAASNFEGVVAENTHTQGAGVSQLSDIANMLGALTEAEMLLKVSHYFTWNGVSGYIIQSGDLGGKLDGAIMQIGDWIQLVNTGGDVTDPADPNYAAQKPKFELVHISGDTLSKNRADGLYSFDYWSSGSYEKGSIVTHGGKVYRADVAIIGSDVEPHHVGSKWSEVDLSAVMPMTYFGKGEFDNSHAVFDASNNYGMPIGTHPDPQVRPPLNTDVYFDVLSGSNVLYTVTPQAGNYTIQGTLDPLIATNIGAMSVGVVAGKTDFLDFHADGSALTQTDPYFTLNIATDTTPNSGHFAGETTPAGDYYVYYTGHPTADNGGWVIFDHNVSMDWTIGTPTAQNTTDVITTSHEFGHTRDFIWEVDSAIADKALGVIRNFSQHDTGMYTVIMEDLSNDGAIYEFRIMISGANTSYISPEAINPHNTLFSKLGFTFSNANGIFTIFPINAISTLQRFKVTVRSYSEDLSPLEVVVKNQTSNDSPQYGNVSCLDKYPLIVQENTQTVGTTDPSDNNNIVGDMYYDETADRHWVFGSTGWEYSLKITKNSTSTFKEGDINLNSSTDRVHIRNGGAVPIVISETNVASGAISIDNIVTLTQAQYDACSKKANTLFLVKD